MCSPALSYDQWLVMNHEPSARVAKLSRGDRVMVGVMIRRRGRRRVKRLGLGLGLSACVHIWFPPNRAGFCCNCGMRPQPSQCCVIVAYTVHGMSAIYRSIAYLAPCLCSALTSVPIRTKGMFDPLRPSLQGLSYSKPNHNLNPNPLIPTLPLEACRSSSIHLPSATL